MENEQATLETKEEKEINRPHYRLICSNTGVGFLNLLNENYEDGYKLDRDTLQFREHIPTEVHHFSRRKQVQHLRFQNIDAGVDRVAEYFAPAGFLQELDNSPFGVSDHYPIV